MTLMLGCKSINEANMSAHEQTQEQLENAFVIHNSRSIYCMSNTLCVKRPGCF